MPPWKPSVIDWIQNCCSSSFSTHQKCFVSLNPDRLRPLSSDGSEDARLLVRTLLFYHFFLPVACILPLIMLELLLLLLLPCLPPFIDLYQTTHSSDMLVPAPSEPLRLPAFAPAAEEQTDCLLWAKSPAQKTFCLFRRWSALWKKHTHNRWNASWKKRNEEESPNLKNSQHQSILLPSSYFLLCWTRRLLIITDLLWCFHVCSDYSSHRSAAVHASSVAAASSVFLSEAAILLCFWTQNQLQKLSSVQLWGFPPPHETYTQAFKQNTKYCLKLYKSKRNFQSQTLAFRP